MLEAFAAERLLTLAADTVEISHEVLLRAWPLLAEQWLAQTHADRLIHTRLRAAAAEWAPTCDPSYLYTGSLLETTVQRLADPAFPLPLTPVERDFLTAGTRAQQRRTRRRRASTTLLVVLVALLATTTIIIQRSRQDTERERDTSIVALLSNQSQTADDSVQAKQLSMVASSISDDSLSENNPAAQQAAYSLQAAATRPGIAQLIGHQGSVSEVAFAPDGKILAGGGDDATVRLWDMTVTSRREIATFDSYGPVFSSVAFAPDGKILASGGDDGTVRLWDMTVTPRREIAQLTSYGPVFEVAFAPDGKTLASDGHGGTVLWDTGTRRQIGAPLTSRQDGVFEVAFTPDGKTLAGGGYDQTVRLWDVSYLVDPLPFLCAQVGRSFTAEEWERYVPEGPVYRKIC